MFTIVVDNQNGDCGNNCPFLDIQHPESIFEPTGYCLLFKVQLEQESKFGPYYAAAECDRVCERTEMIEKQRESVL